MGWKTVASVGLLTPLLGGCNIFYYAGKNIINEPVELYQKVSRTHHLRKEAKAVWNEVVAQYPRKGFTCEFHDGFIDGYADYLNSGGSAQAPTVPPKCLTRNKYMNPEGHELIRDYYLGFKYGTDVAVASGMRPFKVVPVLLPQPHTGAPTFTYQPRGATGSAPPDGSPLPEPRKLDAKDDGSVAAPSPRLPVVPAPAPTPAQTLPLPAPSRPPAATPMSAPRSAPLGMPTPVRPPAALPLPAPTPVPNGLRLPPVPAPGAEIESKFGPSYRTLGSDDQVPVVVDPADPLPARDQGPQSRGTGRTSFKLPEPPSEVPDLPAGAVAAPVGGDDDPADPVVPSPLPAARK